MIGKHTIRSYCCFVMRIRFTESGESKFRIFLCATVIILALSGAVKLASLVIDSGMFRYADPLIAYFSKRTVLMSAAIIELVFALFLIGCASDRVKFNALLTLVLSFWWYRCGLWIFGITSCDCLGNAASWIGLSRTSIDNIAFFALTFMTVGVALWYWWWFKGKPLRNSRLRS